MSDITVVTTCSQTGFEAYGHKMLRTFIERWSTDIQLTFYDEDLKVRPEAENVTYKPFPPWFLEWKERHKSNPYANGKDLRRNRKGKVYDFRQDCVKFAHKVGALTDIGLQTTSGKLLWIDADTLTHTPVDAEWVNRLNPTTTYLAWLDRIRPYPECGFLLFDCTSPSHLRFMKLVRDTYATDRVFSYKETHDSYIFMQLMKQARDEGWMKKPFNLSGAHSNRHHPFPFSELGSRLDHAKGARKIKGRTPKHEVKTRRTETYWK